jgi:hypothetical protein
MKRSSYALGAMAAVVLTSLGLAACGGGDDNDSTSVSSADQGQITEAIQALATGSDPSACTQFATQKFVDQTNGPPSGQAAVQACEKDYRSGQGAVADSVEVTNVQVDGSAATASAKATGNIFDGQTIELSLVQEDGTWKLDVFKGFSDFDKTALINAFKGQLQNEGASSAAVNCVTQNLEKQSDQTLEKSFTESSDNTLDQQVFTPCSKYFKQG